MYNFDKILDDLRSGHDLSIKHASYVSEKMFEGTLTDEQIKDILLGLNNKGVSIDELVGFAKSMREISSKVEIDDKIIDSCGTGGDGMNTFNISTCSSFIAAACGVKVAKHGNKAITSSSGSADLLHDAGAKIDLNSAQVKKCIETINFGFMFAPLHHKAMKNVASSRKSLSPHKTIFNMLGPITNPANARIQLIGVYDRTVMNLVANALLKLGTSKAIILNSRDGLDEASIYAKTDILEIKDNQITSYCIDAHEYGIKGGDPESIKTSENRSSLEIIFSILNNEESDAKEIAILNAALLVMLYKETTLQDAIGECRHSLESFSTRDKFNQYIDFTNQI